MIKLPCVAALCVAAEVVRAVTTVVAQLAEVCGPPLVDPLPVQPQLRRGAESLVAEVAGLPTQARVQGLVGLQAVPARGSEIAEAAAVRLGSLVLQGHVLGHAAGLLAAEGAGLALQLGLPALPFGSWMRLLLLVNTCVMCQCFL